MASKRERVGLILLGIFLGLVVSASFLWWQQNLIKKDWFSFKGIRSAYEKLFDSESDVLTQKQNFQKKSVHHTHNDKPGSKEDSLDAHLDSLLGSDSADISYLLENGALEYYIESGNQHDTLSFNSGNFRHKILKQDSTSADTSGSASKRRQGDFVVKRDQFLMTKLYAIAGYPDSTQRQNERLDSILTNDGRSYRLPANSLRVEFWRSPVNYIGYKLSTNRLVLFGSFNPEDISFEYHNRKVFLKHKNSYYLLDLTNDFQSLVNVKHP